MKELMANIGLSKMIVKIIKIRTERNTSLEWTFKDTAIITSERCGIPYKFLCQRCAVKIWRKHHDHHNHHLIIITATTTISTICQHHHHSHLEICHYLTATTILSLSSPQSVTTITIHTISCHYFHHRDYYLSHSHWYSDPLSNLTFSSDWKEKQNFNHHRWSMSGSLLKSAHDININNNNLNLKEKPTWRETFCSETITDMASYEKLFSSSDGNEILRYFSDGNEILRYFKGTTIVGITEIWDQAHMEAEFGSGFSNYNTIFSMHKNQQQTIHEIHYIYINKLKYLI